MAKFRVIFAGVALLALGVFFGRGMTQRDVVVSDTQAMPMVLRQVQALGELRTARYAYENVFEHRTHLRPTGFLSAVPGADRIADVATGNAALVSVDGTVDAGVDLRQARLEGNRIILPAAQKYEPQVHAKIHQVRRGLFWRDENLPLEAIEDAKSRMAAAAVDQGILQDAERNAISQVRRLVPNSVVLVVQG